MFRSALALASLSVFAFGAHADDTFHRTLNVSDHTDVYVSTGSGHVRVMPASGNQVEITGHVHAGWGSMGDVQGRIAKIVANPPIEQNGDAVHVGEAHDRSLFNNISIDYEIRVPVNAALNLHSGSGDIETQGVGRFLAASAGSGSVRAHQVHGPTELESGSGDLELELTGPGSVRAKSGSGSIRVHNLDGSLWARTGSGDIQADGKLHGASNASSGSGSVRLHLNNDLHANLEASTGSGTVRVHTPGVSSDSGHHLTMAIGGGGPQLQLSSGSGDIEVSAQ